MTDSPLEVGLRIGLDESVNGSYVSLTVAATTSSRNVLVITADSHHRSHYNNQGIANVMQRNDIEFNFLIVYLLRRRR
jgi:hypothetical protein